MFTIGETDGHLYQIWQLERGDDWSDWTDLGPLSILSAFYTQPDIIIGSEGWWQAFAVCTYNVYVLIIRVLNLCVCIGGVGRGGNKRLRQWHKDISINRTLSSVPDATFVYLTTSEIRTPHVGIYGNKWFAYVVTPCIFLATSFSLSTVL